VALGRVAGALIEPIATEWLAPPRAGRYGGHDDDLMPAIARLLDGRGVLARELGLVCVSVGPGGYTSVRIACATGKMIAEGAGCACVAVPTCCAVLAGGPSAGRVAVALAGKGETAWLRVFDDGRAVGPGRVVGPGEEDAALAGVAAVIGDAHVPAGLRAAAGRAGAPVVEPVFDPASVLKVGAGGERIDPALLNPVYPREPDAVTLWRQRHG
jgi:tRNA threonylcarbamoyladenosine biosynthesis protein TsaB